MDNRLTVLKLALEALDIPTDIDSLDDRKRVQKAVYLGQITGVDLGYRYGWYLMGPYSAALTRDYYALADALGDDDATAGQALRQEVREPLERLQPLMNAPHGVELAQEDWLELVASLHYLQKISGLSYPASLDAMKGTAKERLLVYADTAQENLGRYALL